MQTIDHHHGQRPRHGRSLKPCGVWGRACRGVMWLGFGGGILSTVCGQDLIHFKDGQPAIRAQVLLMAVDLLKVRVILDTAQGTAWADRQYSLTDVSFIDFAVPPDVQAMLDKPTAADLPKLIGIWNEGRSHCHRPQHYAPRVGLTAATLSLINAAASAGAAGRALEIVVHIEKAAWGEPERHEATRLRLQALMALGRTAEAEALAKELMAKPTTPPGLATEAHLTQALASEVRLEAFLKAHPRWMEDDEAKPEGERLFHQTVDLFLWPSLFQGTGAELAARGLLKAAAVLKRRGEAAAARATAEDILLHYPESSSLKAAQAFLTTLPRP
jgi:hypothetical protein